MPRAAHEIFTFWIRALLLLATYALTSFSFQIYAHESENEHVHCGDPGVTCEQGEDMVEGDPPPPDPSTRTFKSDGTPTPSTGHSNPTNSASDNCEGSGCINYEESYGSSLNQTVDAQQCPPGTYPVVIPNPTTGEFRCLSSVDLEALARKNMCLLAKGGATAVAATVCAGLCSGTGPGAIGCGAACGYWTADAVGDCD